MIQAKLGDRLRNARGGGDFGGEIALGFLDALAELEAFIGLERDRRTGVLGRSGDDIGDRGLAVDHEQLAEQRVFLAELGHRAFDHLLDDVGRLAALGGLFHRDRALALDQRGVEVGGKPANIIEKMVEGGLAKYRKENALLSQLFVIDGKTPVADVVAAAAKDAGSPIVLKAFERFQLGEGIEKATSDFAAEVAATAGIKKADPVA